MRAAFFPLAAAFLLTPLVSADVLEPGVSAPPTVDPRVQFAFSATQNRVALDHNGRGATDVRLHATIADIVCAQEARLVAEVELIRAPTWAAASLDPERFTFPIPAPGAVGREELLAPQSMRLTFDWDEFGLPALAAHAYAIHVLEESVRLEGGPCAPAPRLDLGDGIRIDARM